MKKIAALLILMVTCALFPVAILADDGKRLTKEERREKRRQHRAERGKDAKIRATPFLKMLSQLKVVEMMPSALDIVSEADQKKGLYYEIDPDSISEDFPNLIVGGEVSYEKLMPLVLLGIRDMNFRLVQLRKQNRKLRQEVKRLSGEKGK